MAAVQPGGDDCGDEELGAVGVGAGVGHGCAGVRGEGGVERERERVRET
jgi:hypothetical protein